MLLLFSEYKTSWFSALDHFCLSTAQTLPITVRLSNRRSTKVRRDGRIFGDDQKWQVGFRRFLSWIEMIEIVVQLHGYLQINENM